MRCGGLCLTTICSKRMLLNRPGCGDAHDARAMRLVEPALGVLGIVLVWGAVARAGGNATLVRAKPYAR